MVIELLHIPDCDGQILRPRRYLFRWQGDRLPQVWADTEDNIELTRELISVCRYFDIHFDLLWFSELDLTDIPSIGEEFINCENS